MKQNYGKIKALPHVLLLFLATVLTGCGREGSAEAGGRSTDKLFSRAEYIGMLGEFFGYDTYLSEEDIFQDVSSTSTYYPEIQAAAEWQVIDRSESFEPDEAVSLSFALESAVRAVGVDDIAASGAAIDSTSLAEFYVNNIAQIDLSDAEISIDADTARQIIEYARNYDFNLVLPQITEMEFVEGVKQADKDVKLHADGATGVLPPGEDYSVGDILYLDATENSLARAVKITGIQGQTFTFEEASLEETYAHLNIQGTFQGNVVEAVSASDGTYVGLGQELYEEMKAYQMSVREGDYTLVELANSAKVDSSGNRIVFTANFDVGKSTTSENRPGKNAQMSSKGQLKVGIQNIRADVKYEAEWYKPFSPKVVECRLYFDTEISSEIHGNVATSIPLGEAYIQVWGPMNIKLMLIAHLGADGNVSISYTTENVMTVGWRKSAGLSKSFHSNADVDFDADATLAAEATLQADLRLGYKKASCSVTNAQVTSGAVAVAKIDADLLGDQPTCVDLKLHVPLKWGVNQAGCIITDINSRWKHSAVIWDSVSSPVKLHMHLEDWQRTSGDICTRADVVEQEITTPEGEALEEIDPFEFEPLEFDFIELVSYIMYLEEGESLSIGFENIPEGYTQDDLKYEIMDSSVCTVSNGLVKGNAAGSTIVKISTRDGIYTVLLAVTVNEDYSVEGFQSL